MGMGLTTAGAEPLKDDEWSTYQGTTIQGHGVRSKYFDKTTRILSNPNGEPRTQHARTPHEKLHGSITPNHLHFTIIHNGIPDIDPDKHKMVIHGMVRQPRVFTLDKLMR